MSTSTARFCGVTRRARHDRDQVRLRPGAVRCLHHACRRRGDAVLHHHGRQHRRERDRHDRGDGPDAAGAALQKAWLEVVPRNAVGTNTAHNTSAIDTNAPSTSSVVLSAASRRLKPCARCRSTFSTTTMASSTTMPTASTRPNSVRLFDAVAKRRHRREGADQRYGDCHARDDRRAPALQEHQHHDDNECHRALAAADPYAQWS